LGVKYNIKLSFQDESEIIKQQRRFCKDKRDFLIESPSKIRKRGDFDKEISSFRPVATEKGCRKRGGNDRNSGI
jgi:hypothetical protein